MSEEKERLRRLWDEKREAQYRCKEGDIPKAAAEMIIAKADAEIKKIMEAGGSISEDQKNAAPFPSVVVVFSPETLKEEERNADGI